MATRILLSKDLFAVLILGESPSRAMSCASNHMLARN